MLLSLLSSLAGRVYQSLTGIARRNSKMAFPMPNLSDLTSAIGGLVPSASDLAQQVAMGAAVSVVTSGLKAQLTPGGALDPLGLFKSATPANNPNAVSGATITASAFASLPSGHTGAADRCGRSYRGRLERSTKMGDFLGYFVGEAWRALHLGGHRGGRSGYRHRARQRDDTYRRAARRCCGVSGAGEEELGDFW